MACILLSPRVEAGNEIAKHRRSKDTYWVLNFTCPQTYTRNPDGECAMESVKVWLFCGERKVRDDGGEYFRPLDAPKVPVGWTYTVEVKILEQDGRIREQQLFSKKYTFGEGEVVRLKEYYCVNLKGDLFGASEVLCQVIVKAKSPSDDVVPVSKLSRVKLRTKPMKVRKPR
jgi:hypothetical protein